MVPLPIFESASKAAPVDALKCVAGQTGRRTHDPLGAAVQPISVRPGSKMEPPNRKRSGGFFWIALTNVEVQDMKDADDEASDNEPSDAFIRDCMVKAGASMDESTRLRWERSIELICESECFASDSREQVAKKMSKLGEALEILERVKQDRKRLRVSH